MTLRISSHATRRMAERGISVEDVAWVLSHPIGDPRPGDGGNIVYRGTVPAGHTVDVVVQAADKEHVITAWIVDGGRR